MVLNSAGKEAEKGKVGDNQIQLRFLALPNKTGAKVWLLLQKSHCPFLTKTQERQQSTVDSRDAKPTNLDDSQPEGKVRNLALIFLCENFPAVSTITVRVGSQ